MNSCETKLSVFTKPWKNMNICDLAKFVYELGFDGIEFPLREGYQVQPDDAVKQLPVLASELDKYKLKIMSVASSTSENIFKACQSANVPLIRIMLGADLDKGYLACEDEWVMQLNELIPLCEKYGVKVGIQPHYGPGIFNTMELRHLLEKVNSRYIGAIWDAAHSGLAGEEPEQALDIIWEYLLLVNLKTAYYRRYSGPEDDAVFKPYFTVGNMGASSWPRIIKYLKKRGYEGDICMPAEYTDEDNVQKYLARDIGYVKTLLEQ